MQSLVQLHFYRDTIARVTQEYITGLEVSDDEQPDDLYMDLAWKGLRSISDVQAWAELTPEQRDLIDSTINNYIETNKNETCTD